jgi:MFS family permease
MKALVTSLTGLLCLLTFSSTFASGAFPAVLPEIARVGALADWQLGIVAGAFGFARMVADVPLGLFLTHHLRRALWLGPLVMASGVLFLTSGGGFWILVLGRLLMGIGQALGIMASITAILRFQMGSSLASALNANEFAAMIGMLGGTIMIAWLPSELGWNTAYLLACSPQLLALVVVPALLAVLPPPAGADASSRLARSATSDAAGEAHPAAGANERRSMVPLAFAAGASVAIAYSTMEQFLIPLRASRQFGLERAGVARLLMIAQLFDLAALIPAGVLADRQGAARVLVVNLLLMATANAMVGFGGLPVVVVGCAMFGLAMTGWMLPLSVLRQETPPERIAWRTGLYRVCVDAGMFLGPFLAGLLGTRFVGLLPIAWTAALALTALLLLARARSSGTMAMHG